MVQVLVRATPAGTVCASPENSLNILKMIRFTPFIESKSQPDLRRGRQEISYDCVEQIRFFHVDIVGTTGNHRQ